MATPATTRSTSCTRRPSAGLEAKNPAAFAFLQKFQLTTEQQNEIAAMIDGDGMDPADAAQTWVDANPDVVAAWTA